MTGTFRADTALRRVLSNAGVLLGGRVANAIMGLAAIALTARALGVERFGVLILIHAFAQFLGEAVKFQSWQTVLHYGARPLAEGRRPEFQAVLRFALVLDLIGTLVGIGIGLAIVLVFGDRLGLASGDRSVAALYVLSVAFMVSATPMGLLRLFDRFNVLARQTALVAFVRLAGSAIAFALGASMPVFMAFWGAGVVVGFVYLALETWAELRRRDLLTAFTWRGGGLTLGMPGAWRFAWSTNLSATLDVAFTHVITLTIGVLLGPTQAALWRIGRQVADAIAKPARLLTASLYPELARLHASDTAAGATGGDGMWRLVRRVAVLAGALGAVLMVVTLGGGAWLLRITMGAEFAAAAPLMSWQVAAAVVGLLALPFEPMLVSLGRADTALKVRVVVCVVYLAAMVPIVTRFGTSGAAISLVVAAVALGLGMVWSVLRIRTASGLSAQMTLDIADRERKAEP